MIGDRIWVWGANNAGQLGLGYFSEQVSTPKELILPSKPSVGTRHVKYAPAPESSPRAGPAHATSDAQVRRNVVAIQGGGSHTAILVRCQILETETSESGSKDANDRAPEQWYEVTNYGMISTKHEFPTQSILLPSGKPNDNDLVKTRPQIACGWDFSLYLNSEGQLFSCGDNNYGQLGRNGERNMMYAPIPAVTMPCSHISAGLRHAAVICEASDELSHLMVWGDNSKKQLGLRSTNTAIVIEPTKINLRDHQEEIVIPVKVRCGKHFTIVLTLGNIFYGCGLDKFGIFGRENGTGTSTYLPDFMPLELAYPDCCKEVKDFQCGWNHVLVLMHSGRILSWGRNNFYQLGRSTSQNPADCDYDWTPNFVSEGLPDYKADPVVSIACGSEHSLALTKSGRVYAWGWNEHENCGIPIKCTQTDHVIKIPTLVRLGPSTEESESEPSREQREPVVLIGCGAGNSFAVTSANLPSSSSEIQAPTSKFSHTLENLVSIHLSTCCAAKMPIIFDQCGMIEEAKKNPCSLVCVDICPPHIIAVWDAVSTFIEQQFCAGHGVKIPGLGMITFKVYRTDVSHRQAIVDKIPVMLLSEHLVQKYSLKAKRPPFNLDIPETSLNFSAIAAMVCLPRSTVETCVQEVVQAFTRAIIQDTHVEFHFPRIGRIIIQCCEVHYRFKKEFLCSFGFEEVVQGKLCPAMNCCNCKDQGC